MTELDVFDFKLECTFADNWRARLDREVALLLSTPVGSMPLDREFGINTDFIDAPPEAAKSLYTAEVVEKIQRFIPAVRVREITWEPSGAGKLSPKVVITSA